MRVLLMALLAMSLQENPSVEAIRKTWRAERNAADSLKQFDEAARRARAALDRLAEETKDPQVAADALQGGLEACEILTDHEGAVVRLRRLLEKHQKQLEPASVRFQLAEALAFQGKDADSRAVYEEILKLHPDHPRTLEARLALAEGLYFMKKPEEAVKALEALAKEKGIDGILASVTLAQLHLRLENVAKWRACLDEIGKDPELAEMVAAEKSRLDPLGKALPAVELTKVGETPILPARFIGRVLYLYFFSERESDSSARALLLKRLRQTFKTEDLAIVGISIDEDEDNSLKFVAKMELNWPLVMEGRGLKGPLAKAFNLQGLPHAFLVDRKGIVRFVTPLFTRHGRELGMLVDQLVAEKP